MRVGVDIRYLEPGYDEEDVYLRNVLTRMHALQPDTHFILFTSAISHNSFPGWDRVFVGKHPSENLNGQIVAEKTVDRAARHAAVDLVFTSLRHAADVSSNPVVPYTLDLSFLDLGEPDPSKRHVSVSKETRKVCARAHAFVAPSEFVRQQLLAQLTVPIDKVIVAPPGVDEAFEQASSTIAERPYIVTFGETHHENHLRLLLDAFSKLMKELPHNLVVVGRPAPHEPEDWGPRVLRIHQCPVAQLAGLLQHADAFVCTSLHEGASVSVLVAMRGGARVIAPRIGGITEIARDLPVYYNHESVGSLMSAVRRVLAEDPDERVRQVTHARARAREFTWDKCAWRTLAAFKKVLV
jgi:glycosyltransferase involved in cell wall biosynthesis